MYCNKLVLFVGLTIIYFASVFGEDEDKLSWKEDDGLEVCRLNFILTSNLLYYMNDNFKILSDNF